MIMMSKNIYAIYDKKAGYFNPDVIVHDNDDCAKRWFDSYLQSVKVSNPNAPIVMYPGDFELYNIGTFDLESCLLMPPPTSKPVFVVAASSFLIPFVPSEV